MRQNNYTRVTNDVVEIYRLTRIFLVIWITICLLYVLFEKLYLATKGFSGFNISQGITINSFANQTYLVLLNTLGAFSKTFPIFFMILYTGLSLNASRVLVSHSIKPIIIFWFVQAFNFVFIISTNGDVFASESQLKGNNLWVSIAAMILVAFPFLIFRILKTLREKGLLSNSRTEPNIYDFVLGGVTNLPHNLYIAIVSIMIALIFNLNLLNGDLSVSNGIIFGLGFSFLILSSEDLQKLVLYFLSPDTYLDIYTELLSSRQLERQRVKSETLEKKVQIDSEEAVIRAQMAKNESANKIRELLASANNIYIDAKRQNIEEKIQGLKDQLLNNEITLDEFGIQMEQLFREIEAAYHSVRSNEVRMLTEGDRMLTEGDREG